MNPLVRRIVSDPDSFLCNMVIPRGFCVSDQDSFLCNMVIPRGFCVSDQDSFLCNMVIPRGFCALADARELRPRI
jgi:hypothetical protein